MCLSLAKPALASVSTPSATPTIDIGEKYKQIVDENVSSIAAQLQEKVNLMSLVGFVGKITTISAGNLTLDSDGNLLQVTTTSNTSFLKDANPIKITSLAIGDKAITIGTSIKDGIVQAKRITVVTDDPVLVKTSAIVSKIISIDLKKKTLNLSINGSTQILSLSKKSTVKLEDLKADQTILAIVKEYNGALSISRAKAL